MAPKKKITSTKAAKFLPEGFEEVAGSRVDGWFVNRAENAVQGRLLESFLTKTKFTNPDSPHPGKKRAYKIEITQGRTIIVSANKEDGSLGEEMEVGPGAVIGMDEKGFIKRLGDVQPGRIVYVMCQGKDKPSKDFPNGAWRFVLGVKKDPEGTNPETGEVPPDDDDEQVYDDEPPAPRNRSKRKA